VPDLLEVSADHGERKEDRDTVRASLGIGCQFCLGDLLYRDKAQRALDELLSTAREHQPLFLCSCVRDPRRRNESRISLTSQRKRHFKALKLGNGGRDRKRVLRYRVKQVERPGVALILGIPRGQQFQLDFLRYFSLRYFLA
jgi:hypothetical protein